MRYRRKLAILLGFILTACQVEVVVNPPDSMLAQDVQPTATQALSTTPADLQASAAVCPPVSAPDAVRDGSYIGTVDPWSEPGFELLRMNPAGSYQGMELESVSYLIGSKRVIFLEMLICEDEMGVMHWKVIDEIILTSMDDHEHIYMYCYHLGLGGGYIVGVGPIPDGTRMTYPVSQAWAVNQEAGQFEKISVKDVDGVLCDSND